MRCYSKTHANLPSTRCAQMDVCARVPDPRRFEGGRHIIVYTTSAPPSSSQISRTVAAVFGWGHLFFSPAQTRDSRAMGVLLRTQTPPLAGASWVCLLQVNHPYILNLMQARADWVCSQLALTSHCQQSQAFFFGGAETGARTSR